MEWLKDKKNQPIVAGILAVVILGVAVGAYFMFFKGDSQTAVAPPAPGDMGAPAPPGDPGAMAVQPSGTPGAVPGAPGATPGVVDPAAAGAPPAAQAAVTPAGGAVPQEGYRPDPFTPVGYKPPPKIKRKPKIRIADLPIQNWSQWSDKRHGPPAVELPQPVRRMAGLMVSDRIYAIIETNGASEVVQPGDVLKDRMAMVERIERDQVVLKTMDKSRPRFLIVRMAKAPKTETRNTSSGGEGMSGGDSRPPMPMGGPRPMAGPPMGPRG